MIASGIATPHGIRDVVYVAGIENSVFALDGETGEEVWTHTFKSVVLPGKGGYQGTFLCPNGITATPVIDRASAMIYVIAADGSATRSHQSMSGKVRYGPVQFVAPFAKSWSLNLVGEISTRCSLRAAAAGCPASIRSTFATRTTPCSGSCCFRTPLPEVSGAVADR